MNKIEMRHLTPSSESEILREFLVKADEVIMPRLSERVDISQYAEKLSKWADLFYLLDGEKIVANAAVYLNGKESGYISSLAVLPEYQRRGLATILCQEIKAEAQKKGIKDIRLEVYESNEKATRFYRKQGFIEEEKENKWLKMVCFIE